MFAFFWQLEKLAANGEESLVLTATLGESEVSSPVYSKLGADFFYIEQENIEEMGRKFHSYCQGLCLTVKLLNIRTPKKLL